MKDSSSLMGKKFFVSAKWHNKNAINASDRKEDKRWKVEMLAIGAKWERMNWFVRDDTWSIIKIMNASFRDMKSPLQCIQRREDCGGLLIRLCALFFCYRSASNVNEREMDAWIEAVMAPFLLILPLLASLHYLIQPIGKWCSSSMFIRWKMQRHREKTSRSYNLNPSLSESPLGSFVFGRLELIINWHVKPITVINDHPHVHCLSQ